MGVNGFPWLDIIEVGVGSRQGPMSFLFFPLSTSLVSFVAVLVVVVAAGEVSFIMSLPSETSGFFLSSVTCNWIGCQNK